MAEIWPSELQDILNTASFQLAFGDTTISSEVDVGPKKKRARYTKGIDVLSCSIDLEYDTYATLETFYKVTLGNGVNTFLFDHPMTGIESTFRFTTPPSITPLTNGGRWFRVGLSWEEMP